MEADDGAQRREETPTQETKSTFTMMPFASVAGSLSVCLQRCLLTISQSVRHKSKC